MMNHNKNKEERLVWIKCGLSSTTLMTIENMLNLGIKSTKLMRIEVGHRLERLFSKSFCLRDNSLIVFFCQRIDFYVFIKAFKTLSLSCCISFNKRCMTGTTNLNLRQALRPEASEAQLALIRRWPVLWHLGLDWWAPHVSWVMSHESWVMMVRTEEWGSVWPRRRPHRAVREHCGITPEEEQIKV